MPAGTCPPDPYKALLWLHDRVEEARAARDWEAVGLALEQAAEVIERLRLDPLDK